LRACSAYYYANHTLNSSAKYENKMPHLVSSYVFYCKRKNDDALNFLSNTQESCASLY
jgi:hypothetical protein